MAIKLAVFDMEGTLFAYHGHAEKSSWALIAHCLGEDAKAARKIVYDTYRDAGHPRYSEWVHASNAVFKKYGLTKEKFEEIINSVDYFKGVKETFLELKKRGITTAIISGGIKAQAERAQKELGVDHIFTATEYSWHDTGELKAWKVWSMHLEGKLYAMQHLMKKLEVTREECLFVGDGFNDVPIAQAAGISISFNGDAPLEKVATHVVKQPQGEEDFSAVLDFIGTGL